MDLKNQNINSEFLNNKKLSEYLLKNIKSKKLQNSIILYGDKGIGKATLIKKVIKNILNINKEKSVIDLTNPNFYLLTPLYDDKKKQHKNNIIIDQIRLLDKNIKLTNLNILPKFILIDSIDSLNLNASNALLKILEEPPINTYFFLISHQLNKILPTIRSRCIKINIKNPDFNSFKNIVLSKNLGVSGDQIIDLFYLTNSSPGLAIDFINYDFDNIKNKILDLFLNKELLNDDLINFSEIITKNDNSYLLFIYIIKFILFNSLKNQYNISEYKTLSFVNEIKDISTILSPKKIFHMLEYINNNEENINKFNLDKKIFIINFFSEILLNK